ncbi:hypothetical protein [Paramaledivibacter caminithermalis]|jgi:hypothetical protein|uniref:Uncharacterized protein n=1 Tax=Paramaledivibacter caminithermalis (strain DSM 15212 / CIP 107654 / DViRD3) TaxID=1121301 RepID=A0A1M6MZZ4_PARC5|nr:hypothetical protein [Paramaledivibacter caminithermalis]SHJ89021.1 hypothetical protein SAMN02745912_01497 [Paramaledivibacter caminithermalis DSM 15212]
MFKNKKILIASIIIILFAISLYYVYKGLNNETVRILEYANESLKTKVKELNQDIEKLKGIIGVYDKNIENLNRYLDSPIYQGNEEDQELLKDAYNFISSSKQFDNVLVFQLGPVRKETEGVYFIDFLTFENLDTQNIFDNLDTFFPTELLKQHVIRCYKENNSMKYEVID